MIRISELGIILMRGNEFLQNIFLINYSFFAVFCQGSNRRNETLSEKFHIPTSCEFFQAGSYLNSLFAKKEKLFSFRANIPLISSIPTQDHYLFDPKFCRVTLPDHFSITNVLSLDTLLTFLPYIKCVIEFGAFFLFVIRLEIIKMGTFT